VSEFIHQGDEKKKYVQKMFDDISHKYDFLNHLLSFGVDKYWRRILVQKLNLSKGDFVLDVATGTGDVGFAILKKHNVNVIGLDYAYEMTVIGREKAKKRNINQFTFVQGDGENLPFIDNAFQAITISFGFRNIGHYNEALKEFYRVLKPGGQLEILEFSQPKSKLFSVLYKFYFSKILPKIAGLFARNDAYRYLPESVDNFPTRDKLIQKMTVVGFNNCSVKDLTFGISSIFSGVK
jgi:demethylmenaquinone methyltransferase / 2-methoxy-6-polyprenyl-1,4-benzoquinol methylase